jgi:transcriptional regulator with XRE-family HTH domain
MTPLGEYLKKLRGETSVREFAEKIGKSPGYVSRIEVQDEVPSAELLCKIAEIHRVDPTELFRLAKKSELSLTAKEIDQKHEAAIALYRRGKK